MLRGDLLYIAFIMLFNIYWGWPKSLLGFCKRLWKNPNEVFGQPSMSKYVTSLVSASQ